MQVRPRIKKFQQGGPVAPEEPMTEEGVPMEGAPEEMPQEGGGEDPLMMLVQGAAQALQTQDCNIAMQVCQGLIQLVQQMQGGAPEEPQGEPVFRKGGTLVRRIRN